MFQKFCCGIRFCRLMHIIGYAEFNSLTNFVLYLNQFIIKKIGLLFSIVCHKNSHYIFCFLLVVNILHKYRYFLTTQYDARVPLEVTAHYAELSICLYWVILNYASFLLHAVISKFFSTAVSASCHQKFTEDLTVCSVCAVNAVPGDRALQHISLMYLSALMDLQCFEGSAAVHYYYYYYYYY